VRYAELAPTLVQGFLENEARDMRETATSRVIFPIWRAFSSKRDIRAQDHRWQLTGKPRHQCQYDPFHQAWSGRL
jgi:hypothetical protein